MFVLQMVPGGLTTKITVPYATTVRDGTLYLCKEQGPIHPAFILAAYATNNGWSHATIGYNPADTAAHWMAALEGLITLAKQQDVPIFLSKQELATQTKLEVVGVTLEIERSTREAPTAVVDNIFVSSEDYGARTMPRKYLMAALEIEKKHGASVAALIVSSQGAILSCRVKSEGESGCAHAEVKAIFAINGELPKGGAIISTLKPCAMCMGLIHGLDPSNTVKKFWGRPDPSKGAAWEDMKIGKGLAEYFQLDNACLSYSALKLQNGAVSFADKFGSLWQDGDYGNVQTLDTSDATIMQGFFKKAFKLPPGAVWIEKDKTVAKPQRVAELKKDIKTLAGLLSSLASKKNPRAAMEKLDAQAVERQYKDFRSRKFNEAESYVSGQKPQTMIGFISRAPSAVALRGLVNAKFEQQFEKHGGEEAIEGNQVRLFWEEPKARTQLQKSHLMTYLNSFVAAS